MLGRLSIIAFLFLPIVVFAQIEITEIMYDPKEADAGSGGEWIEVYNSGGTPIDLTEWIFFENETNHGITADGTGVLAPSGYAVISRDLTAFKNYYSGFSGILFKASFSLNNGEVLAMKSDKEAAFSDSVSYTSEWGAKDDGNSLQKVSGSFVAAGPTPGATNSSVPVPTTETNSEATGNTQAGTGEATGQNNSGVSSAPIEPKIKTSITGPKNGIVGAEVYFKAETSGLTGAPLPGARHIWSFGDGSMSEGQSVVHTYSFPGNYTVVLEASSEEYGASSRHLIKISEPVISFKKLEPGTAGFIELANGSSADLDLSFWQIRSGGFYFVFPKNTFIASLSSAIFPNAVTDLTLIPEDTDLLYPSGFVVMKYDMGKNKTGAVPVSNVPAKSPAVVAEAKPPTIPTPVEEQVTAKETVTEPEVPATSYSLASGTLAAVAIPLGDNKNPSNLIWFGMMFVIVAVSISGYFFLVKKSDRMAQNTQSEVTVNGQKYLVIEDEKI